MINTWRLFVAIPLPEHVKDGLERAQEELNAALPRDSVRWTTRAQLHVTLKFLGNVELARLNALMPGLRDACSGFGALSLRAEGIGVFPNARRPRVIWAGVEDEDERLSLLQRTVETASNAFTAQEPETTFTGHVTLGRCRTIGREQAARLTKVAATMAQRGFGAWTANSIDIVRSDVGPAGSRYTTLSPVPLTRHRSKH